MPIVPNAVEQFIFLTLNQGPGVTFDLWGGPAFHIVLAAIRLNVFETLDQRTCTPEELAAALDADARGIRILLDALTPLGYVQQTGTRFRNSPMTSKWLVNSGQINFSPYYQFWGEVLDKLWGNVEESFRSGDAPVNMYEWIENQPDASRYFQQGMIAIAQYVADDIARMLALPTSAKRLLDIGGGHATYSLALLHQHPQLEATIFDSPQALVTGRENVAAAHLQDRVTFQEGSFLTEELGSGYDVALVFNIIHGFKPDANIDLFQKTARALNPGGMIAIVEQLPDSAPLPIMKTIGQLLSASYFHVLGGQIYPYEDIADWLQTAGFKDVRRKNLIKAGSSLIMATI